MRRSGSGRRLLAVLLFGLAGCAGIPDTVRSLPDEDIAVELVDTPFFAQDRYQCGPAALTTALVASDAKVSLEGIESKVYIPGRKGSLQFEMLAATRTSDRMPYLLDRSLAAIVAELEAGRPVVVLQNLGLSWIPRWHYAVVVGIDGNDDRVVLRSGTDSRRITPIDLFLRTWARSDFWAMSVIRPGEMPAIVDRARYFDAVVGLEQAGMAESAALAWQAALHAWPDNPTALFGLGNARLILEDYAAAEEAYLAMLAVRPGFAAAHNNLAFTLAKQGRFQAALEEVSRGLEQATDQLLVDELIDTRAMIEFELKNTAEGLRPTD